MNKIIKTLSIILIITLFLSIGVYAADDNVYTPLHSKNLLAGKKIAMAGSTINNYDFAEWNGITHIEQINDGILSANGKRQTAIVHGVPNFRINGASYFIVYDLGAYYDLTSAALYSDTGDDDYAVTGWDFYAGETIYDYLDKENMTVGKTEDNDKLDYQIALMYRKVRYVAFSFRHEDTSTNVRLSELEVFGKLSKDQSVKETIEDVKISGGKDIKVKLETVWDLQTDNNSPSKVTVDMLDASARQSAFEKSNYAYKIYESFYIEAYSNEGTVDNRQQAYTVTIELPDSLKNIKNIKLLSIGNIAEEINASYENGKFVFVSYSLGEFAIGIPNYEEDAVLYVTEDFYPVG